MPSFAKMVEFPKFKYLEFLDEGLKILYEPFIHVHEDQKEIMLFLHEIGKKDSPLPQIVLMALDSRDFINDDSPTDLD